MRITKEMIEKIDRAYVNERKIVSADGLGLNVNNGISGATVFMNNWAVCDLEDISQMIEELTILRGVIKKETGFEF